MLMAQLSTYDMFALIELHGRKVQSVYKNIKVTDTHTSEQPAKNI